MQESYREGIASRPGPEPCEGSREAALELKRWTGVSVGWVLSSENGNPGCPWCQTVRRPHGSAQKTRVRGRSCGVEDPTHAENPGALWARENRETLPLPERRRVAGRKGTRKGKLFMHGGRESSSCIVPTNDPNKLRTLRAEGGEGRRLAKEIRRQGPDLDTAPEEPGALHCQWNGPTRMVGDVIIQGGNRVR